MHPQALHLRVDDSVHLRNWGNWGGGGGHGSSLSTIPSLQWKWQPKIMGFASIQPLS